MIKYEQINFHAEHVAAEIYKSLSIIEPSLRELKKWIEENFGFPIQIVFQDLSDKNCSGLIHFDPDKKGYKIVINSKDMPQRQRFTFCHEVAHLIRNIGLTYGLSVGGIDSKWGVERFCDRFAAAFLMPKNLFIDKWNSISEDDVFKKIRIARHFNVSGETVYFRAKELNLIS